MNVKKSVASACIVNNQFIFAIGGRNNKFMLLNIIEKYQINEILRNKVLFNF